MKAHIKSAVAAITFALTTFVMAQTDHSMHGMPAGQPATPKTNGPASNAALGDAVVKKVDKAKGTVTLAHGALPNGMPPMTMAYKVKDTAWLETLQAGQKIRFATDSTDGGMTVSRIETVK